MSLELQSELNLIGYEDSNDLDALLFVVTDLDTDGIHRLYELRSQFAGHDDWVSACRGGVEFDDSNLDVEFDGPEDLDERLRFVTVVLVPPALRAAVDAVELDVEMLVDAMPAWTFKLGGAS